MPRFEWDPDKAAEVWRERGIAFEDVVRVFDDDRAVESPDPDPDEERFKIIGMVDGRLVTVIYTERGDSIRVITAWKATSDEAKAYSEG